MHIIDWFLILIIIDWRFIMLFLILIIIVIPVIFRVIYGVIWVPLNEQNMLLNEWLAILYS